MLMSETSAFESILRRAEERSLLTAAEVRLQIWKMCVGCYIQAPMQYLV